MQKKKTTVAFTGTAEQEQKLYGIIDAHKNEPGALMPILQEAQELYGYLPIEVQSMIASKMDVSIEQIYGVVTFYGQFNLNPKGRHQIAVCLGTACYVKGAGDILDEVKAKLKIDPEEMTPDGLFSLDATRCIGACGLAPVVMIGDDVYGKLTKNDVAAMLDKYKD